MSRVTNSVTYGYKFNRSNYESEHIEISAVPMEGESIEDCIQALKAIVHGTNKGIVEPPPPKVEEIVQEAKENLEKLEEAPKVEPKEPKKGRKKKETTPEIENAIQGEPKILNKKSTPYNPENALHKRLVKDIIDKEFPGWTKHISLIKEPIKALAGNEFLDEEGLVILPFKELLISTYKANVKS